MELIKIKYRNLNARQKENYNYHKVASVANNIKQLNKIMIRHPEQILIRLEKGQNEALKRDANRFGLSVSSYVRLRLFNCDLIDLT